jgi:hypothetical protein
MGKEKWENKTTLNLIFFVDNFAYINDNFAYINTFRKTFDKLENYFNG